MRRLSFVCCVNRPDIAQSCALTSPCLQPEAGHQLILVGGATSAGRGMATGLALAKHEWVVMLHQDVFLPDGWDERFCSALDAALDLYPKLAVAGVYGVRADGVHVGHVLDRGILLGAPISTAAPVRSLDELLVAVRASTGLCPSPTLGWHLYGTDLCLAAQAQSLESFVLDGFCEHRSVLPRLNEATDAVTRQQLRTVAEAFAQSAAVLLCRWPHAMPVHTPVMPITADFHVDQLIAWLNHG